MKKLIVLALSGLMIVILGSTMIHAQKLDFKVSGFISTTTILTRNDPGDVPFGFLGPGGVTDGILTPFNAPFRPPARGGFETNSAAWNRTNGHFETRARLFFDVAM